MTIFLNQNKIKRNSIRFTFLILLLLSLSSSLFSKEVGFCYVWSEGDSQGLIECKPSSLESCSKGKKAIKPKDTAFQNYSGKLFREEETQNIFEFKNSSVQSCENDLIKTARSSELTMCDNWGKSVYSTGLKVGDKAFIYGNSVNLRESANTKSKKLFSPQNGTEVKILEKSKNEEKIENLYSSYWFKVSVDGKTGWVYGQFLHPNPKSKEEFIQ